MTLEPLTDAQLAKLQPHERTTYAAEQKHQETWGHLPPQLQPALRGMELPTNAVEVHARAKKTNPVHFAAARAYHRWAIGQEMTAEEYDAALEQVLNERHGR